MKQNQRQPRDIIEARKFEHLYINLYMKLKYVGETI